MPRFSPLLTCLQRFHPSDEVTDSNLFLWYDTLFESRGTFNAILCCEDTCGYIQTTLCGETMSQASERTHAPHTHHIRTNARTIHHCGQSAINVARLLLGTFRSCCNATGPHAQTMTLPPRKDEALAPNLLPVLLVSLLLAYTSWRRLPPSKSLKAIHLSNTNKQEKVRHGFLPCEKVVIVVL